MGSSVQSMGMGRNRKSLMGIPWEWELVTKFGMGMERNGNRLHGNERECECKKPFPGISSSHQFWFFYVLLFSMS